MTQRLGSNKVRRLLSRQELRRTFRINDATIDLWVDRAWLRRTTKADGAERFRVADGGLRLHMQQLSGGRAGEARKRRKVSVEADQTVDSAPPADNPPVGKRRPRRRTVREAQQLVSPEVLAEATEQLFPPATAKALQKVLGDDRMQDTFMQESLVNLVTETGADLSAEAELFQAVDAHFDAESRVETGQDQISSESASTIEAQEPQVEENPFEFNVPAPVFQNETSDTDLLVIDRSGGTDSFDEVASHLTDLAADIVADVEAQVVAEEVATEVTEEITEESDALAEDLPVDSGTEASNNLSLAGPELFDSFVADEPAPQGPQGPIVESTDITSAFDQIFGGQTETTAERDDDHLPPLDVPPPSHFEPPSIVQQLEPAFATLGAQIGLALQRDDLLIASVQKLDGDVAAITSRIHRTQQETADLAVRVEALSVDARCGGDVRPFVAAAREDSARHVVLLGTAVLLLSWAVVFFVHTGDLRLTIGGLVLANLVGCALLASGNRER